MIKMRSSVLRGHWVTISLLLFIFILAPTHVVAKMDLPPLLNTEDDYRRYIEELKAQLPEVVTGRPPAIAVTNGGDRLATFVRREQNLMRRLLNEPRYRTLVEQRPDLQTFEVRQVVLAQTRGPGLRGWEEFLHGRSWPQSTVETIAEIRETIAALQARSSTAFFSAIAQVLSKDMRIHLKTPDVRSRWRAISRNFDHDQTERLKKSLRAEAFGLPPDWTLSDLDRIIEEIAQSEDQLVFLIQSLWNPVNRPQDSWLLNDDWDEVLDGLELSLRDVRFIDALRNRYRKKFVDPNASIVTETPQRVLRLREAPPFHAVFRGCVGRDCSTDNSWSFPYSPFERYWWIEDDGGNRLGYVSGAITTFQEHPCLYIRDVTGPNLAAGDVTLILNGFYLAKRFFGADQMTIMPTNFIIQNHFESQRTELHQYPTFQRVIQTFSDEWIRNEYLHGDGSGNTYDSIAIHSNARLIRDHADLGNVRVQLLEADVAPRSSTDQLWSSLLDAMSTGHLVAPQGFSEDIDWRSILDILKNESRLPTQEFYKRVESTFQNADLPISRNLMRKYEIVFERGHLNASNAFSDEKARKKSVRYLQDLIWRQNNKELAGQYIEANLQSLENDVNWIHLLEGLFSRRGAEDAARIQFLWEKGCRFTGVHLSDVAAIWLLGQARSADVANWALDASTQAHTMSPEVAEAVAARLENEDESIPEEISVWVARVYLERSGFIMKAPLALLEAQASMEGDENVLIRFPLALAYVRDMPSDDPFVKTALKILKENIDDEDLPRPWKQKARRVLSAKASLLEEDCEERLTRGRGNG